MEKRELTCIGCPLGCSITVTMENAEILDVTGNTCKRGDAYARKEVTHPTRIVTSTVRVSGGTIPIFAIINALCGVTVPAPVSIGDILVQDVAGTGVDIVATKNVPAKL